MALIRGYGGRTGQNKGKIDFPESGIKVNQNLFGNLLINTYQFIHKYVIF